MLLMCLWSCTQVGKRHLHLHCIVVYTYYGTELFDRFLLLNILMWVNIGSTWNDNFGADFTSCSDMPLVYAHYDNVPSFYDYDYAPFGGWGSASGKQFWDAVDGEVVCGVAIDWDWSPEAFWKK